jgi:hypothetical protein
METIKWDTTICYVMFTPTETASGKININVFFGKE